MFVSNEWIQTLTTIVVKNIEKYGTPIPIDKELCIEWGSKLGLNLGGEVVIYTSYMYQMVPYITKPVEITPDLNPQSKSGTIEMGDAIIATL